MKDALLILEAMAVFWGLPWIAGRFGRELEGRLGHVVRNYRGAEVPLGLGWAWVVWSLPAFEFALGSSEAPFRARLLVLGAAALGWLDDRFGAAGPKGFHGHIGALGEGRVTTGMLKLAGTSVLALAAAWALPLPFGVAGARGIAAWLLAAAVIALTVNLVNLFDLRPGRALKAYCIVAVPSALAAAGWGSGPATLLVLIAAGPAIACLPADLRERSMLGDMGANAAGAVAGWLLASVLAGSLRWLAAAALVLLALNLASERVSFSAVIERTRVLRWIDRLGRLGHAEGEERVADGETGT